MTVGFPEWMGIYILIYSQTRNVWVLLKDVLGKIDMKKVNHGVIYLAYFGHHFNMTVKSYACPLHEARKSDDPQPPRGKRDRAPRRQRPGTQRRGPDTHAGCSPRPAAPTGQHGSAGRPHLTQRDPPSRPSGGTARRQARGRDEETPGELGVAREGFTSPGTFAQQNYIYC